MNWALLLKQLFNLRPKNNVEYTAVNTMHAVKISLRISCRIPWQPHTLSALAPATVFTTHEKHTIAAQ